MKGKLAYEFQKIVKGAAEKTAIELLKRLLLFIFTSGMISVLTHLIATQSNYIKQYAIILSVSIASGLGYLITAMLMRRKEYDYKILSKVYEYQYESKEKITFTKTFIIKATTKRCDRLFDRYNFTGSGAVTINCDDKNFKIIHMPRNDNYQRIEVTFGRTLEIGETITVILDYYLEDPLHSAVPFLCSTIIEPTDYQKLVVKVPVEWGLKDAIKDIRRSAEDHHTKNSGTLPFINGICTFETHHPQLHNIYSLKWDFESTLH